jgi:hypothetical protein
MVGPALRRGILGFVYSHGSPVFTKRIAPGDFRLCSLNIKDLSDCSKFPHGFPWYRWRTVGVKINSRSFNAQLCSDRGLPGMHVYCSQVRCILVVFRMLFRSDPYDTSWHQADARELLSTFVPTIFKRKHLKILLTSNHYCQRQNKMSFTHYLR